MFTLREMTREEAEAIYNMNLDTEEGQYIRDMFEAHAPLFRSYLSVYDTKTIQYHNFAWMFDLIEKVLEKYHIQK